MRPTLRRRAAVALLWVLAIVGAGCASTAPREIVSRIPGDLRPFQIVRTEVSKDRSEATVTFSSSFGIFAFDLDLAGLELSKLTLVVQKQQFCEGLTFQPKDGRETDLRHAEGVKVSRQGNDLFIEIGPSALARLKKGGRVQYVNQYR